MQLKFPVVAWRICLQTQCHVSLPKIVTQRHHYVAHTIGTVHYLGQPVYERMVIGYAVGEWHLRKAVKIWLKNR